MDEAVSCEVYHGPRHFRPNLNRIFSGTQVYVNRTGIFRQRNFVLCEGIIYHKAVLYIIKRYYTAFIYTRRVIEVGDLCYQEFRWLCFRLARAACLTRTNLLPVIAWLRTGCALTRGFIVGHRASTT